MLAKPTKPIKATPNRKSVLGINQMYQAFRDQKGGQRRTSLKALDEVLQTYGGGDSQLLFDYLSMCSSLCHSSLCFYHSVTLSLCHSVTLSVTLSLCHCTLSLSLCHCTLSLSLCHSVTLSLCNPVTLSPCHPVTLSPCHPVTLSPCHPVTLSPCHPVTLSSCHPVTLSPCYSFPPPVLFV
jgi:hypothetical protein